MTQQSGLRGKKVAILAADGFEYVELAVPRKALLGTGAEVEVVSLHEGRIRGMNLTEPTRSVRVDRSLDRAGPDEYDALFVPGGFVGPDFLRQSKRARAFVRDFDASGKPIATLCHGPWLLVSAELVAGRSLASWPGIRDDIVHAGGIWRDEPLVRDRNWVSSRGPHDMLAFVRGMLELFTYGSSYLPPAETAGVRQSDGTSSPKPDEPARVAVAAARRLPGPAIPMLAAAAVATVFGAVIMHRVS